MSSPLLSQIIILMILYVYILRKDLNMKSYMTLLLLFFSLTSWAQAPGNEYVELGLQSFQKEGKTYLAVNFSNQEHWHTYWINPGDSGLAIKNIFSHEVIEKEWPIPKRFVTEGDIWGYGYEGKYSLFYEIKEIPSDLSLHSKILVCKNICVPAEFTLNLENKKGLQVSNEELSKRFQSIPQVTTIPQNLELVLTKGQEENSLELHAFFKEESNLDLKNQNLLYPFPTTPFAWGHHLLVENQSKITHIRFPIEWDGEYLEPEIPFPSSNKFDTPIKARFLFKNQSQWIVIEKSWDSFLEALPSNILNQEDQSLPSNSTLSLPLVLLFALLGGFILNFMPCVLPVISLKLFGLIGHSRESSKRIKAHNLAYTAGVLLSFFVLALIVHILKASGEQIGWGFQLQSPLFVFLMCALMLIMSFNLFGLFEFKTPFGSKLGGVHLENNLIGDFGSGILSVILATPCSAPFLGTAIGYAFTSSTSMIYILFLLVGLGLSLPFILSAFFPKILSIFPKPGNWMNTLKYFLGFAMFLTFLWLYDVLSHLIDYPSFALSLNTFFLCLFGFFFFSKHLKAKWGKALFFALSLFFVGLISKQGIWQSSTQAHSVSKGAWSPWSQEILEDYRAQRKWVFMDFTAKWCLTCKVNKKLVLETDSFLELAKENNLILLQADWTQRDPKITSWLNKYQLAGVPAYFMQSPEGKIHFLGETISISEIQEVLGQ